MCDKFNFDNHERRISQLEKADAVHDAKLDMLTKQVRFQMITVWGAFFLVLLALIWGALGPSGFNAVTKVAPTLMRTNGGEK